MKDPILGLEEKAQRLSELKPGEPCWHPGCFSYISHPCEVCGRIKGYPPEKSTIVEMQKDKDKEAGIYVDNERVSDLTSLVGKQFLVVSVEAWASATLEILHKITLTDTPPPNNPIPGDN